MNKNQLLYIILGLGTIGGICWKTGVFEEKNVEKTEDSVMKEDATNSVATRDKKTFAEKEESARSSQENERAASEKAVLAESETHSEHEKELKTEARDFTDELNNKTGKIIVKFKDGEFVRESEITDEMEKLPEQISERMSLKEIKSFLAIKSAFDHVIISEAKKEGIDQDPKVREEINKRKNTVAGMMLLNEKAQKLMTDEALKAHYDKVWEENFKGTKEFSLKVITASDKVLAENIVKVAVNETELNKILEANKLKVKAMDIKKPAVSLPSEIINPIKDKGPNSCVGPFPVGGAYMVFFVKDVQDATKHKFSGEFKEEYKKIATKDFIKQVNDQKYKENSVKFYDINGKEIDIDKQNENIKTNAKSQDAPDDQFNIGKLNDETVLARIGATPVYASEIKGFFKLKSWQDESLIMMAQQFNMRLAEVLVYATKLVVEDKLLAKEVKETDYMSKPNVKGKMRELEKIEISKAFLKRHTNISPEQIKRTYADFIKAIPEEDKNDHEISMKIAFFPTKEQAEQTLSNINSGQIKFSEVFKEKELADKSAVDFKYVTRRTTDPELWSILKKSSVGTCYKEVIETDSSKFGVEGMNYAIIYVGDKRPVTLPSLSNPADKRYFEAMAYQQVAAKFVTGLLSASVVSIYGKSMKTIEAEPSYGKMIEAIVAGSR